MQEVEGKFLHTYKQLAGKSKANVLGRSRDSVEHANKSSASETLSGTGSAPLTVKPAEFSGD